ncbi:MAG: hypothetical protein HGJ94_00490 [Desulfosarcina sp.]|nr:hypothetical protein [Desulfosarcina sp.]MBC2743099.1 hypothetical protein [Desulfosarcina sp.]MBC2766009.1 hypothetical protein [Desulfosarcina sp.]
MALVKPKFPPNRITDLITFKNSGASVASRVSFEILPVDFAHRDNPFQAYVFLSRYAGDIDGREYEFRKCYARGCPNNLCPHVSQAVMIANRYLQRDYHRLEDCGIPIEKQLFTLQDMMVKFDNTHQEYGSVMAIHDYLNLAREGNDVSVEIKLEYVPAVEHFAGHKNAQIFLMASFGITCLGKTSHIERCLACYPEEKEKEEKSEKMEIANERLKLLYEEFERASVKYGQRFFQ